MTLSLQKKQKLYKRKKAKRKKTKSNPSFRSKITQNQNTLDRKQTPQLGPHNRAKTKQVLATRIGRTLQIQADTPQAMPLFSPLNEYWLAVCLLYPKKQKLIKIL